MTQLNHQNTRGTKDLRNKSSEIKDLNSLDMLIFVLTLEVDR